MPFALPRVQNDAITAFFAGNDEGEAFSGYYPGIIAAVKKGRNDGHYDVEFNDGDTRQNVPRSEIRASNVLHSSSGKAKTRRTTQVT